MILRTNKQQKITVFLFSFSAVSFAVVGLAKIVADAEFLQGGLLLTVATVLALCVGKIRRKKLNFRHNKKAYLGFLFLNAGFVFLSMGMQNLALFVVGFLLLLSGLFVITNKKDS